MFFLTLFSPSDPPLAMVRGAGHPEMDRRDTRAASLNVGTSPNVPNPREEGGQGPETGQPVTEITALGSGVWERGHGEMLTEAQLTRTHTRGEVNSRPGSPETG